MLRFKKVAKLFGTNHKICNYKFNQQYPIVWYVTKVPRGMCSKQQDLPNPRLAPCKIEKNPPVRFLSYCTVPVPDVLSLVFTRKIRNKPVLRQLSRFFSKSGPESVNFCINSNCYQQCCGSGSLGSICFWATRIRIRQSGVRIRILLSSSKNSKKNLDSYCFVTSV